MAEKSQQPALMQRYLAFFAVLLLSACTASDKAEINDVLDQRDASISQKNIQTYTSLLSSVYHKPDEKSALKNIQHIFDAFDKVKMSSRDRRIQIIDDEHAICEQTYILQVLADGDWRKIVQREQLKFHKDKSGWKISSGL
jgi:hypothetical protein